MIALFLGLVRHANVIDYVNTLIHIMSANSEDLSSATTMLGTGSGSIQVRLNSLWIRWWGKTQQVDLAVWECHFMVRVCGLLGSPCLICLFPTQMLYILRLQRLIVKTVKKISCRAYFVIFVC